MAGVRAAGADLGAGSVQGPVEAGGGVVGPHGVQGATGQGPHHQHHLLLIRHNLLRHHILPCATHRPMLTDWLNTVVYEYAFLAIKTPSHAQPCR